MDGPPYSKHASEYSIKLPSPFLSPFRIFSYSVCDCRASLYRSLSCVPEVLLLYRQPYCMSVLRVCQQSIANNKQQTIIIINDQHSAVYQRCRQVRQSSSVAAAVAIDGKAKRFSSGKQMLRMGRQTTCKVSLHSRVNNNNIWFDWCRISNQRVKIWCWNQSPCVSFFVVNPLIDLLTARLRN